LKLGLESDIFFQIHYDGVDAGSEEFDRLEVGMGCCCQENVIVVDVDKDSLDLDDDARARERRGDQEGRCRAKVAQGDLPGARIDPRSVVGRNPSLYPYHVGRLSSHSIQVAWKTSKIHSMLLFQYPQLVDMDDDLDIPHEHGNQLTPFDQLGYGIEDAGGRLWVEMVLA